MTVGGPDHTMKRAGRSAGRVGTVDLVDMALVVTVGVAAVGHEGGGASEATFGRRC